MQIKLSATDAETGTLVHLQRWMMLTFENDKIVKYIIDLDWMMLLFKVGRLISKTHDKTLLNGYIKDLVKLGLLPESHAN